MASLLSLRHGRERGSLFKTLWFSHRAHQELLRLAANAADGLETGGMLFGYTYPSTGDIVVTKVTSADLQSQRRWNLTTWDHAEIERQRHVEKGDAKWEVGDWHTHPVSVAEPSGGDEAGQRHYREESGWRYDFPDVLLIVGVPPGGTPQDIGAWFYERERRTTLAIRVASPEWNPVDENGNWIERGA